MAKRNSPFGKLQSTRPTTGDGWTSKQKPKISETNLSGKENLGLRVLRGLLSGGKKD